MKRVKLPDGAEVPALGQGTWMMAEDRSRRTQEIDALRRGLDLGMSVIDTAEMYGEGAAEELVGEALAGRRDQAFLVSKVYPRNASRTGVELACARSLKRLKTDRLDLYLLHWRGGHPLAETIAGFEALVAKGMIRRWGVSNFDVADMEDLLRAGGQDCATNQILYNLARRGPEFDLLPWQEERSIPAMAYSPIEQGRLRLEALRPIAAKHGVEPFTAALAFVLRRGDVIAIPKASSAAHVEANRKAAEVALDAADLQALNRAFPPPRRKVPLEMI